MDSLISLLWITIIIELSGLYCAGYNMIDRAYGGYNELATEYDSREWEQFF